ncbi:hypothetical protein T265_12126 [Opisthorchis viverrini]|uniref:Uncharacterized protein n=1 Tax=Opisthorchis viverrini TaxID=6198 RepID=A0A074YVQ9_OPIVI|nr:hypothetical protein T265_12126 [Opisthorchis viverrini]KER18856.1 hypothetical protein T265_12126 [Opisthorchis viverrini]
MTSAAEFAGNGFHTSLPSHCSTASRSLPPFTWLCENSFSRKSVDWHTQHVAKPAQPMQCDQFICRGSVVRSRPLHFNFPCLGLGDLAVSQPSCFLQVAWQLGTGRVLEPNSFSGRNQPLIPKKLHGMSPINYGSNVTLNNAPSAVQVLLGVILHRLIDYRERQTRESQVGFRLGRGCTDHIFTLR